ncbi:hypothetical protein Tco_0562064 [Tanacetum coccineum]
MGNMLNKYQHPALRPGTFNRYSLLSEIECVCKEKGHFVNNCPVWKKKGKAKIVEEEDKESVAKNHKPTIGKLKPREPYTQVYRERIMISGDYLVLGIENRFWDTISDLKKIFEDYLLHPQTYYEFAKGRQGDKYTKGLGTFKYQGEGRKPNKYTEGLGTFKDQGEGRKPNKYTKRLGTFEDQGEGRKTNKYTEGLGTFKDQGEGRKPNKYTEGLGTFEDQGEGRKPNKYTEGMGTFEDQGEGRKPNKYTEGMGTFKDQAEGLADHFRTSAAGMDIASKHASTNKALKEIKKEDDDFPIV